MTLFKDITRSFHDEINGLNTMMKAAVAQFDSDTKTDQNYVTSNITGEPGSIFMGQGANACIAAINRNALLAQHGTMKFGDLQLACDQLGKELDDLCSSFDNQSIYYLQPTDIQNPLMNSPVADPYLTTVSNYSHTALGYSMHERWEDRNFDNIIIDYIREFVFSDLALSYVSGRPYDIDTLLTPGRGPGTLEDNINAATSSIQSQFQAYQSQRHNEVNEFVKQGKISASNVSYPDSIDVSYKEASRCVTVIARRMTSGYIEWDLEFLALVGQFRTDVTTASDMQTTTVGELTTEINTGPYKKAKVIILMTPNGIVVVVKGGVNSATVEQDIQKYLQGQGLPSNTPITLFGYQDGAGTAKQVIKNGKYDVTNFVVVGPPPDFSLSDLPPNVNVYDYGNPPPAPTQDQEATLLGLKPDQIVVPLTLAVVGLLTAGEGDLALLPALAEIGTDVGPELGFSLAWNKAAEAWNNSYPQDPLPILKNPSTEQVTLTVILPDGTTYRASSPADWQEVLNTLNAQTNPGQTSGPVFPPGTKFYAQITSSVPQEPGANSNNFTNSSYLNSQPIP